MYRRIQLLCALLSFLVVLDATGKEDLNEFRVLHVRFKGAHSISKKKLAKSLAIQPSPRWRFWQSKTPYTMDDLDEDVFRIKRTYENHGYYHTEVRFEIKRVKGKDLISLEGNLAPPGVRGSSNSSLLSRIKVVFIIEEGPPAIVTSIALNLAPKIPEVKGEAIEERFPITVGGVFNVEQYRESKKEFLKSVGDVGYPFAQISGKSIVDTTINEVSVKFDLAVGQKCRFGTFHIPDRIDFVRENVIHRALEFHTGETYSVSQVNESLRNLYSLDVFKTVVINPVEPTASHVDIPLSIEAEEKKKRNIRLGFGYGDEDGARAQTSWTYRNIFGWAGKLSLNAKRSDLIQNVELNYTQPYFWDAKNTLDSTVGHEREFLESHDSRKLFGRITLNRNFKKYWAWEVGYNLESSEVEELNISDPDELEKFARDNNFLISSTKVSIARNTVDNDLNPKKGSVIALSIESASTILGSEVDFISPNFEIKKHIAFYKNVILSGHLSLQVVQETENTKDIPIFKRLFLGGGESVRGYGFQKLGPLDTEGDPIGGLSSLLANLELRYPIYKKIAGALFLDLGTVDEEPFSLDVNDLRYSSGIGLRYDTAIGPIRVDFGYKLNPPKKGDFGNTVEPNEEIEDRWKVHISIGQAF